MVESCARKRFSQVPLHSKGGMAAHFFRTMKICYSLHAHFSYPSELKNIKSMSPNEDRNPIHLKMTIQISTLSTSKNVKTKFYFNLPNRRHTMT